MKTTKRMPIPALELPLEICVISGEVVLMGQGSTGFSMTRAAAIETSRRLTDALSRPEKNGD